MDMIVRDMDDKHVDDWPEERIHPVKIFEATRMKGRPTYICAPMVRYSKLAFRSLVREYSVDLCYTPMVLAKEFVRSSQARDSDFSTNFQDTPTVVQFGASSPLELARAASLVQPFVSGVDLNCGCPQSWACQDGLGAVLMRDRAAVAGMVKAVKQLCGPDFCVSVKIRIHKDLRETVDFVRTVEAAGADYLTVHARTHYQRSSTPALIEATKLVKETVSVPVVANGDAFSLEDVERIAQQTGADGVMSARGLMENPTLFAGYAATPSEAVERFMFHAMRSPLPYKLLQHHLSEMAGGLLTKKQRLEMIENRDIVELIDWLRERGLVN
ncbi:tRNA-dihydrouridine synthase-like protein 4-like protein [Viridothelium virens]|uniref:tRNA-dihydrouridine(20a/20b) synthase [NAD(P)+] n=1 Tax=Viridothelium virens TaxID=1048519 RepID=A0A6A6HFM7_VIRVR|nr:tRNA-dihydrouridine synthase-like protein 4-like protein [Viridothelium virens]